MTTTVPEDSDASDIAFNTAIGVVFNFYRSQFPIRQPIPFKYLEEKLDSIIEVCEADEPQHMFPRLAGQAYIKSSNIPPRDYLNEAFHWLKAEGFLHEFPNGTRSIYQLTSKTLAILNSTPKGLNQTLGNQLAGAVKDIGTSAGKSSVSDLVGQIIGSAARSFAS